MQEEQAAGPAREAPQRRAARGGRLQAGLRRRQAAAAAAAAAAEEASDDEPGPDSDAEVTLDISMITPYLSACMPSCLQLYHKGPGKAQSCAVPSLACDMYRARRPG